VLFDVKITNPDAASHWLLVRDQLDSPWELESATANGVEVLELTGPGRVVIGHFHGNQSFLALLLPPRATIKIHRLALSLWNREPSGNASIHVLVANNLTIGTEPAYAWFGINPESEKLADVTTENGKMRGNRFTPDRRELPIHMDVESRIEMVVDILSPEL
jgi:hypothetical protein